MSIEDIPIFDEKNKFAISIRTCSYKILIQGLSGSTDNLLTQYISELTKIFSFYSGWKVLKESLYRTPVTDKSIFLGNAHTYYGIISYFQGVQNLIPEKGKNQQLKDLLSEMSQTLYSMLTEQKRIFKDESNQKDIKDEPSKKTTKTHCQENTPSNSWSHHTRKPVQGKYITNSLKPAYNILKLTYKEYNKQNPFDTIIQYYNNIADALTEMIISSKNESWIDDATKDQIDKMLDEIDIPTKKSNDPSFYEKMGKTKNALNEIKGILLEKLYSYCEPNQPTNKTFDEDIVKT